MNHRHRLPTARMKVARGVALMASLLLALVTPAAAAGGPDVTVTGRLSYVVLDPGLGPDADRSAPAQARTRASLTIAGTTVPVASAVADGLAAGEVTVRVTASATGRTTPSAIAADLRSGAARIDQLAPAAGQRSEPPVLGQHHVTVVPLYWSAPPATTNALVGTTMTAVDRYFNTQTHGKIRFELTRILPAEKVTLSPEDIEYCATSQLEDRARKLANLPKDQYHHVVVLMQYNPNCFFAGMASIGQDAFGGEMVVINDTPSQVVWAHEYGHNLGLIHNAGRVCWSDRAHQHAVPLSNDCQDVTYEDPFDLMGHGWWGWAGISSAHQEKLGVLPAGDRLALSSGGTVTLNSMSTGSGLRSVYLEVGGALWDVEYHVAAGQESWIDDETYTGYDGVERTSPGAGVVVRRISATADLYEEWAVVNPHIEGDGSRFERHPVLTAGESLAVPGGLLTITVKATTSTTATVTLTTRADGVTRWAGADRYETAANIARLAFPGVREIYAASGLLFTDALSGAPVAGMRGKPMFLMMPDQIPNRAFMELIRRDPTSVTLLGGPATLSEDLRIQLDSEFGAVSRIAGEDRYATSAAISRKGFTPGVSVAYVASGLVFPDALSGAPVAARDRGPVLLTDDDTLPAPVAAELTRLQPDSVVVLGGPASIGESVLEEIEQAAGVTPERVSGADRYAVSAEISRRAFPSGADLVFVASGEKFTDALAGAPAAGAKKAPMLLVKEKAIPAVVAGELARLNPKEIIVLGGDATISPAVEMALGDYVD